jgi:hypothetical protein
MDFRGGTYVGQVWAQAPRDVLPAALERIKEGDIPDSDPRTLIALKEDASRGGDPVLLDGMAAVYCADASVGDDLLIAHIVETVAPN